MKIYFTKNKVKVFESLKIKDLEETINKFFLEIYEKEGRIMHTNYKTFDGDKVTVIITYTEEMHPHKIKDVADN